jgi:hypothetical protein
LWLQQIDAEMEKILHETSQLTPAPHNPRAKISAGDAFAPIFPFRRKHPF